MSSRPPVQRLGLRFSIVVAATLTTFLTVAAAAPPVAAFTPDIAIWVPPALIVAFVAAIVLFARSADKTSNVSHPELSSIDDAE